MGALHSPACFWNFYTATTSATTSRVLTGPSQTHLLSEQRIRNGLPTLIEKEVNYEDLMHIRACKQIGAAKKKGRTSADVFEINDEVRIQDMNTKRWNKVGKITDKHEADDEKNVSYGFELENVHETIRH